MSSLSHDQAWAQKESNLKVLYTADLLSDQPNIRMTKGKTSGLQAAYHLGVSSTCYWTRRFGYIVRSREVLGDA